MIRVLLLLSVQCGALPWLVQATATQARLVQRAGVGRAAEGDLAVLLLHVAALLGVVWLSAGTVHATAQVLRGRPTGGLAPRWVRRLVSQALGSVLLASAVAGPAVAQVPGPQPAATMSADFSLPPLPGPVTLLPRRVAQPPTVVTPSVVDPPIGATPPTTPPTTPPGTPPTTPDPAGAVDDVADADGDLHVVSPGENLWVIARGRLVDMGVDAPDDRTVHAYWVRLIAENAPLLRSGDPDLIHPGEVLRLPPTSVGAQQGER